MQLTCPAVSAVTAVLMQSHVVVSPWVGGSLGSRVPRTTVCNRTHLRSLSFVFSNSSGFLSFSLISRPLRSTPNLLTRRAQKSTRQRQTPVTLSIISTPTPTPLLLSLFRSLISIFSVLLFLTRSWSLAPKPLFLTSGCAAISQQHRNDTCHRQVRGSDWGAVSCILSENTAVISIIGIISPVHFTTRTTVIRKYPIPGRRRAFLALLGPSWPL